MLFAKDNPSEEGMSVTLCRHSQVSCALSRLAKAPLEDKGGLHCQSEKALAETIAVLRVSLACVNAWQAVKHPLHDERESVAYDAVTIRLQVRAQAFARLSPAVEGGLQTCALEKRGRSRHPMTVNGS